MRSVPRNVSEIARDESGQDKRRIKRDRPRFSFFLSSSISHDRERPEKISQTSQEFQHHSLTCRLNEINFRRFVSRNFVRCNKK